MNVCLPVEFLFGVFLLLLLWWLLLCYLCDSLFLSDFPFWFLLGLCCVLGECVKSFAFNPINTKKKRKVFWRFNDSQVKEMPGINVQWLSLLSIGSLASTDIGCTTKSAFHFTSNGTGVRKKIRWKLSCVWQCYCTALIIRIIHTQYLMVSLAEHKRNIHKLFSTFRCALFILCVCLSVCVCLSRNGLIWKLSKSSLCLYYVVIYVLFRRILCIWVFT